MVFIDEHLIRKRSEHNNLEICTLEELSLHQCDIERIEFIDKWCRELKILYLQSNLIPRIENVSRLKKLEYLNLALNNITLVENLHGCETLNKLDLTVNFVAKVTSLESLRVNKFLRELYLTGNPCTEYVGYRDYVIATLPQLNSLDGKEISKSERIEAMQCLTGLRCDMLKQEKRYLDKLQKEKEANDSQKSNNNETTDEEFWSRPTKYTPESRLETHRYMEEKRKEKDESKISTNLADLRKSWKRVVRYFADDGRPLNINEDQVKFVLTEDDDIGAYLLDVTCYKHIDASLLDVDIQTNYVRITTKGKTLQLALLQEVSPDASSAKRSQTTGHLLVTMPKVDALKCGIKVQSSSTTTKTSKTSRDMNDSNVQKNTTKVLEVTGSDKKVDIYNIVRDASTTPDTRSQKIIFSGSRRNVKKVLANEDFTDDDEVPPLE